MSDPEASVDNNVDDSGYDQNYYAHHLGIPYERNDHWLNFFGKVADRIVATLNPRTVLDVGCAFGFLVEALRDRGVDAIGTDVSEYAISQVGGSAVGHCSVVSGLEPIEGRFDLITCVEVIEHLDADDGRTLLANMVAASDRILLSSTPHDYAEPTHLNVRPVEYWAELMAEHGMFRNVDHDASYLTSWAGLFESKPVTLTSLARDFERSEFRHRAEVVELRRASFEQHIREGALNDELEVVRQSTEQTDAEAQAQQEELDAANQRIVELEAQVLMARDAAIGADVGRGQALAESERLRGELMAALAHQEHWDQLVEGLEHRVDVQQTNEVIAELERTKNRLDAVESSTTWKVGYQVMAPYRRVRGR